MRKLLNTLFVTVPNSHLARDGENVLVLCEGETIGRFPIHNLESIVHFGYTGATPGLMALCAEKGVALSFCAEHGAFLARVTGRSHGNVLLRRRQYRWADDEVASMNVARSIVIGKVSNSRTVLQRALRDYPERLSGTPMPEAVRRLAGVGVDASKAKSLDELRGHEGAAAQLYFDMMDHLILDQKQDFFMHARSRRPPRDKLNALLSFLYTLLAHDVAAALETVGLDPQVGYLHRDRPGRAGLALDIMEELRPYLADRLALSMVNRRQLTGMDFTTREAGAVYLSDDARKVVLTAWQERKRESVVHPFLKEKVSIGLLPYTQALLLARFVRGDLDGYPPFVTR